MNTAVRPHIRPRVAVGVALLAASAVAVSPMAPPVPDVAAAAHHAVTSAEVELAAFANPIQEWADVLTTAAANLGGLGNQVLADPAPVLKQLITNQLANATVLGAAGQETITGITTALQALPAATQTALGQLASGDVTGAVATLTEPLLPLALTVLQGATDAFGVVSNAAQNFANVVALGPEIITGVALSSAFPLLSGVNATTDTVQSIVTALGDRDLGGVASAVVNAPAHLVGGVLNGDGTILGVLPVPGLLSPSSDLGVLGSGPIAVALTLRDDIAKALHPAGAAALDAAVAPTSAASTVTVKLANPSLKELANPTSKDRTSTLKTLGTTTPTTGTDSSTESAAGSTAADASGRHRAHPDNPVGSVVKKLRDSARNSTGAPRHARAEHSAAH